MEAPLHYMFCRICGIRMQSGLIANHELHCLQEQQQDSGVTERNVLDPENRTSFIAEKSIQQCDANDAVNSNEMQNSQPEEYPGNPPETPAAIAVPFQEKMESDGQEELKRFGRSKQQSNIPTNQSLDIGNQPFPSPKNEKEIAPSQQQISKQSSHQRFLLEQRNKRIANKKNKNLFPPTKKYRHYPVTCEFCGKRFQPGPLRRHIRKYHTDLSKNEFPDWSKEETTKRERPSSSGFPRHLKICYICGQLYGSKSLKIHEPKCLEKWKAQNDLLPKHKRRPEPMKPEALGEVLPGPKRERTKIPDLDPEQLAAYQSHLRSLVPCEHCGRTFNPDRVMVHERVCIERPRRRKYIRPDQGRIK
ncbi:zinc finger protein 474-like [Stegodyphus dumicola]|uniref:zinc finger protein 474-like n=1 Tax=Stegodyphus dumicola TaxID=202533 RepID=UPI0015A92A93|nr:zinc finger protein 474-like [Stegodyphus dumicola]